MHNSHWQQSVPRNRRPLHIQIGSAKVSKYASSESGDTLELIERPHGGLSIVLADGQRSGRSAKVISNIVVRKAISLLGEGVRDGTAARAAHDYLTTHRAGKVSAELHIISFDLVTKSVVISRNSQCPALVYRDEQLEVLDAPSQAIGIYPNTKPVIVELPLSPGFYVAVYTDGLRLAVEAEVSLDPAQVLAQGARERRPAQELADLLLHMALEAERQRPRDDISVLVCALLEDGVVDGARRLCASFPLPDALLAERMS
jgi:serine phosphatase RsbU (regulator of sigma subunit)